MKRFFFICALLLSQVLPAGAKAYFQDEAEMVEKAEVIAIVDLEEPQKGGGEDDPFGTVGVGKYAYRLKAAAKTISVLKGKLPEAFEFHGGESFICAQCIPSKGRFLVFLQKDEEKWVGANWQFSLRPIAKGKIEWYSGKEKIDQAPQDEVKVIARVKELIAQSSK
jgi:hypothetical protein